MTTYADALYEAKRGFMIIGLTGYTGSGCSTASEILRGDDKPELPDADVINKHVDKLRYEKLKKIWTKFAWTSFAEVEVSTIIFMLAVDKSITATEITGPLVKIRDLALTEKTILAGIKYLYLDDVSLRDPKIASQLVAAYEKAKILYRKFKDARHYSLSEFIEMMQNFGDEIRRYGQVMPHRDVSSDPQNIRLLPEAIRRLIRAYRTHSDVKYFVIDAFRNPFEVEFFKRRYSEFYLVAIHRSYIERHAALQNLPPDSIERLETREQGKKYEPRTKENVDLWVTSQNIDECTQKAEIFIENIQDDSKTYPLLRFHIIKLIALSKNPGCIPPNEDERCMQLAISARQNSGCLSRHVGAVVADKDGFILGVGWNDSPSGQAPCILRTGKDLVDGLNQEIYSAYERSDKFINHMKAKYYYDKPFCFSAELENMEGKKKAEFTRALHGEENAFFQATKHGSEALKGATLYSTDSPCNLCAKKAYQLGVGRIVYIEDYPGIAKDQTLIAGKRKISVDHFEGITGSAYFKLFNALMNEKDLINLYQ